MRVSICLGVILIPEYLDSHSGYSAPRSRIARIYSGIYSYSGISQTNAPIISCTCDIFRSVVIFDQLSVLFNQLYVWLFRSVVIYIRSVECFIRSIVHVTFSISCVWYSINWVFYSISCTCDFFDQSCLIIDQLSVLFNQLFMWLFRSVVIDIRSVKWFI